jgi:dihydropteroate synthase
MRPPGMRPPAMRPPGDAAPAFLVRKSPEIGDFRAKNSAEPARLHWVVVRSLVMGVLNVTPDSFSDGGRYLDLDAAVAHGLALAAEGADIVDVGGESTRPGAEPVSVDEELRRVVPVVEALAGHVRLSVDTMKPEVAEAAVAAGATLVNDVSASLAGVAAATGAGWAVMHMQGTPATMQAAPRYDDVVAEVRDFLRARADAARQAGVDEIWIDPGIGFGKTIEHNLSLLAAVGHLAATGYPVLVGASRKGFLGTLTGGAPVTDRAAASLAAATSAMASGASMVRVHDVRATVQAARVVAGE